MPLKLHSIRLLIPVMVIVISILAIGAAYTASHKLSVANAERVTRAKISNNLNYLQGSSEQLIKLGLTDILYQLISSIASEPDLLSLLIVDSDHRVLASNNFSDAGKNWRELPVNLDEAFIERAIRFKKMLFKHNHDDNYLEGYISICGAHGSSALRSGDCGFASYRVDLAYYHELSTRALMLQSVYFAIGLAITVVVMFILMHVWINRPARHIISTLNLFNRGDHEQRIRISNNNEIGTISHAVNQVLDTVVFDEKALSDKEQRLRAIFDNTVDAIITISSAGIIESVNPATETMLGFRRQELIGKNVSTLTPDAHRSEHDLYISRYLETGEGSIINHPRELNAVTKQGREIPITLTVSEMEINGNRFFTGIIRDITQEMDLRKSLYQQTTELQVANLQLKKKSTTDALTGIANRGLFDETLATEIRRAIRREEPLSLILLDVDYFKNYNDYYGHNHGDMCLQRIAKAINEQFKRAGELAARYGGEEFAAILPGTGQPNAAETAEQLRQSIWSLAIPHQRSQVADRVTISIGVSTLLPKTNELILEKDLINSADEALYQAKSTGRNKVCSTSLVD